MAHVLMLMARMVAAPGQLASWPLALGGVALLVSCWCIITFVLCCKGASPSASPFCQSGTLRLQ